MPYNRYYINSALEKGNTLILKGDEWHHLSNVSRGRLGESVELINGKGALALADIVQIGKKEGTLLIQDLLKQETAPPQVILVLALSRMNHLEWAIEKGTELGASAFWLFPGNLSEKHSLSENQHTRLQALILAATKQCGRLYLPPIEWKPPLTQWTPIEGNLFVCDPSDESPYLWEILPNQDKKRCTLFFIGPEKGFDKKEMDFLKTQLKATGVKLHPHILRTETAPLVALSLYYTR